MTRKYFHFIVGFAALVLSENPLRSDTAISLAEVLVRVENENLTVLLNRDVVEQAVALANRERAALLPGVNLVATQRRNRVATIGQGFDDIPGVPRAAPPSNRFDARLQADVPLIDPLLIANYRSARVGERISEFGYAAVRQEVLNAAAQTFFSHLRNLARMEVIDANIERGEAFLELARNQLDAGVATQIDVTRAEVQLAQEEQAKLEQGSVVYQSELRLKRFLNVDLHRDIAIRDFRASRRLTDLDRDSLLEASLEMRPDYQQAETTLEQNRLERRAATWERFPTLRLLGDYGYASSEAFDGQEQNAWSASVTLSMPVFEGFRIRANRQLADARVRSQQFRLRDLEEEILSELLVARQQLESRLAQIEVAEKNVSLAEEELRLATIRFEQGVADNREIIDAQNRIARANDGLVEAVFIFNLSRLEYARARGDVRYLLGEQEN